jgi:RNA polymerase sigma-70 factor, ECF subfamily
MRVHNKLEVSSPLDDESLVRQALAREPAAFRAIIQRHNRRLYRIARSILRNDSEAEDAVQETYIKAFTHLQSFRAESSLSTWLSRIAMNEALERLRRERPMAETQSVEIFVAREAQILAFPQTSASADPERAMAQREIIELVERAADGLPEIFRIVFVMRVIEGMSVEETAALLDLEPKTVKTRLHRARKLLRKHIEKQIGPMFLDAFPFAGARCERMTTAVLQRLGLFT